MEVYGFEVVVFLLCCLLVFLFVPEMELGRPTRVFDFSPKLDPKETGFWLYMGKLSTELMPIGSMYGTYI